MTQFQYKPLEKSAKKVMGTENPIRAKLKPLDPVLIPLEAGYEKIKPIPIIGPIVTFLVKVIAVVGIWGGLGVLVAAAMVMLFILAIMISSNASTVQ